MSDNILDRYSGRGRGGNGNGRSGETEIEDCGSFGFLRGARERAVMLELRKKDGNILAVGYGWIERIEYDPSDGITLHLAGQKVRIKGRNLNSASNPSGRLFEATTRHRVPWIQESDLTGAMTADPAATVIDSIEW